MNNIHLSQMITMLFLAIWHGLASGYFVSFGLQGLNLTFERYFIAQLKKSMLIKHLLEKMKQSTFASIICQIIPWGLHLFYTPFIILGLHTYTYDRYLPIMKSIGFFHWLLIRYLLIPVALNISERIYQTYLKYLNYNDLASKVE